MEAFGEINGLGIDDGGYRGSPGDLCQQALIVKNFSNEGVVIDDLDDEKAFRESVLTPVFLLTT